MVYKRHDGDRAKIIVSLKSRFKIKPLTKALKFYSFQTFANWSKIALNPKNKKFQYCYFFFKSLCIILALDEPSQKKLDRGL